MFVKSKYNPETGKNVEKLKTNRKTNLLAFPRQTHCEFSSPTPARSQTKSTASEAESGEGGVGGVEELEETVENK